ncbi:hypothetical protein HU200_021385 [Digitaria exilis]|uniref:Uncharacterized protein n=1 Tax=Digitaria exilis TaxID=1010633 RepID=A0A835F0A7_9POAL|nr:hypothetical protein HU200_021385 [Digitaria exilis]
MIEAPGHVVARASDVVTKDRRVRAMAADELLRAGEVYLLVPAGRAGARLGDREVEAIGLLVSGKKKKLRKSSRHGGGKRVFPAAAEVVDMEEDAVVENGPWIIMGFGPCNGGPPLIPSMRPRFVKREMPFFFPSFFASDLF